MKYRYLLGSFFLLAMSCSDDESNNAAPTPDSSAGGTATGGRSTGGRASGGTSGTSTGGQSSGGKGAGGGGKGGTGGVPVDGGSGGSTEGGTMDGGDSGAGAVQLTVTIAGSATGKVHVTGPGVDRVLTTSTVLDVRPGTYSVASESARVDGTYVDTLFDPDAATKQVAVTAGQGGSVTVTYAKRPGTGHLWVTWSATNQIVAYSNDQLARAASGVDGGTTGEPAIVIGSASVDAGTNLDTPHSLAFDAAGNLWVSNCGQQNLLRYSVADLGTSGGPNPDRVVAVNECVRGIAFGPTGLLGMSGYFNPLLLAPADLARSGTVSPRPLATPDFFGYGDVAAFDSTGNLWMGDYYGDVYRWNVATLAPPAGDAGPAGPDATFGGVNGPSGITWMKDGTIMLTAYNTKELEFFDPSQLQNSGTPVPTRRLSVQGGPGLAGPQIPAFDEQGNLWFPDYETGVVVGYTAAALATTSADGGTPVVNGFAVLAVSDPTHPVQAVTNPAPTWAPVFTP